MKLAATTNGIHTQSVQWDEWIHGDLSQKSESLIPHGWQYVADAD